MERNKGVKLIQPSSSKTIDPHTKSCTVLMDYPGPKTYQFQENDFTMGK